MHIILILLLILIIIFSPAILGITALSLAVILTLLLKMAIPLSVLFITYWILGFIEKRRNGNLIFGRCMFVVSMLIASIISIVLWIGEQYALSCFVFLISITYQSAKRYIDGLKKYDNWIIHASGLILSWYIPMVISTIFFYDYFTLNKLGISDAPGIVTYLIALSPLCLFVPIFFEQERGFVKSINSIYVFIKKQPCYFSCIMICAISGVLSNYIYLFLYKMIMNCHYSHTL